MLINTVSVADGDLPITEPATEPLAQPATAPSHRPVAESAILLQGQAKGFPVMPQSNNMLDIPSHLERNARNRFQPSNGTPINGWETVLLGKKLVPEDPAQQRQADIAAGFAQVDKDLTAHSAAFLARYCCALSKLCKTRRMRLYVRSEGNSLGRYVVPSN